MITLHITQTIYKDYLERRNDPKYLEYIYKRVAEEFASELWKHIEPYEIIDLKDSSGIPSVVLHFKIQGGSLPEHEDESNSKS